MRIIDEHYARNAARPLTRTLHLAAHGRAEVSGARGGQAGGFLSLLRGMALRIRVFQQSRAAAEQLAGMSDHELADIGLSRGGLQSVFEPTFEPAMSVQHRTRYRPEE